MTHRIHRAARFAALSVLTLSCGLAACASPTDDPGDDGDSLSTSGDGEGQEQNLTSEHQLVGSELPDKTVSLTFDDGPGQRTAELAEYLASEGIQATFFINGKNVPGRQAAIDAIVGRGHLLANHTQNHLQLTKLGADKVVSEVTQTDAFIARAQPDGPFVLRAPFGAWSGATSRAVNGTSMKKYVGSVFWDMGGALTATAAADWDCWGHGMAVERCGSLYMNEIKTKKHGIILMHDVHNRTVDMVKTVIVPQLKAQGFSFAKLVDVPSVKRAIANANAPAPEPGACSSATLGRTVPESSCVQSARDQKWSRCVDGEWTASSTADAACVTRYPLH